MSSSSDVLRYYPSADTLKPCEIEVKVFSRAPFSEFVSAGLPQEARQKIDWQHLNTEGVLSSCSRIYSIYFTCLLEAPSAVVELRLIKSYVPDVSDLMERCDHVQDHVTKELKKLVCRMTLRNNYYLMFPKLCRDKGVLDALKPDIIQSLIKPEYHSEIDQLMSHLPVPTSSNIPESPLVRTNNFAASSYVTLACIFLSCVLLEPFRACLKSRRKNESHASKVEGIRNRTIPASNQSSETPRHRRTRSAPAVSVQDAFGRNSLDRLGPVKRGKGGGRSVSHHRPSLHTHTERSSKNAEALREEVSVSVQKSTINGDQHFIFKNANAQTCPLDQIVLRSSLLKEVQRRRYDSSFMGSVVSIIHDFPNKGFVKSEGDVGIKLLKKSKTSKKNSGISGAIPAEMKFIGKQYGSIRLVGYYDKEQATVSFEHVVKK